MKSIFRLIVLLLLLGGWGLAALSLHVVRTDQEIPVTLVPKANFGLTDTYVDTRNWTLDDVAQHPQLVQKLIESGKAEVLRHVVGDAKAGNGDIASQLTEAIQRGRENETGKGATTSTSRKNTHVRSTQPASAPQAARNLWGLFQ